MMKKIYRPEIFRTAKVGISNEIAMKKNQIFLFTPVKKNHFAVTLPTLVLYTA
jgi:hypothetical protein